jgi:hypothetical protein
VVKNVRTYGFIHPCIFLSRSLICQREKFTFIFPRDICKEDAKS